MLPRIPPFRERMLDRLLCLPHRLVPVVCFELAVPGFDALALFVGGCDPVALFGAYPPEGVQVFPGFVAELFYGPCAALGDLLAVLWLLRLGSAGGEATNRAQNLLPASVVLSCFLQRIPRVRGSDLLPLYSFSCGRVVVQVMALSRLIVAGGGRSVVMERLLDLGCDL